MDRDHLEHQLLRELTEGPQASQRGLAGRLGVSVGKVNYCLQALVGKGWVKVNNFKRSDNKMAYAYLLTPTGAVAKLRLTRAFLAQKEREFEALQAEIVSLRVELTSAPAASSRRRGGSKAAP